MNDSHLRRGGKVHGSWVMSAVKAREKFKASGRQDRRIGLRYCKGRVSR